MKKIKSLKVSQCMIVKNEEKNIRQALSWGKEMMWEQIVVDTGSSDRTAAIAEELGAKVFTYEWTDNFAAAKNYAISQAQGDWIALLDADEYITKEDVRKIQKVLPELEEKVLMHFLQGYRILMTRGRFFHPEHRYVFSAMIRISATAGVFMNSWSRFRGENFASAMQPVNFRFSTRAIRKKRWKARKRTEEIENCLWQS